jgi:hypothetical protein
VLSPARVGVAVGLGSDPPKIGFWKSALLVAELPAGADPGRVLAGACEEGGAPLLFLAAPTQEPASGRSDRSMCRR